MSKFQREVDEYKKQTPQTGGAYYGSKSNRAIEKPSWMTKSAEAVDEDVDEDFDDYIPNHPHGGYRLTDLPKRPKQPVELPSPFDIIEKGNTIRKIGNAFIDDVLPFLEEIGLGFL